MTAERRRAAFRLGLDAETRAAWLLRLKGYAIVARRFRVPGGEVDLVARRGGLVIFVEVKARPTFDEAVASLRTGQMRRSASAARAWLARSPGDTARSLRFDAVLVAPGRWPRHIQGAANIDL